MSLPSIVINGETYVKKGLQDNIENNNYASKFIKKFNLKKQIEKKNVIFPLIEVPSFLYFITGYFKIKRKLVGRIYHYYLSTTGQLKSNGQVQNVDRFLSTEEKANDPPENTNTINDLFKILIVGEEGPDSTVVDASLDTKIGPLNKYINRLSGHYAFTDRSKFGIDARNSKDFRRIIKNFLTNGCFYNYKPQDISYLLLDYNKSDTLTHFKYKTKIFDYLTNKSLNAMMGFKGTSLTGIPDAVQILIGLVNKVHSSEHTMDLASAKEWARMGTSVGNTRVSTLLEQLSKLRDAELAVKKSQFYYDQILYAHASMPNSKEVIFAQLIMDNDRTKVIKIGGYYQFTDWVSPEPLNEDKELRYPEAGVSGSMPGTTEVDYMPNAEAGTLYTAIQNLKIQTQASTSSEPEYLVNEEQEAFAYYESKTFKAFYKTKLSTSRILKIDLIKVAAIDLSSNFYTIVREAISTVIYTYDGENEPTDARKIKFRNVTKGLEDIKNNIVTEYKLYINNVYDLDLSFMSTEYNEMVIEKSKSNIDMKRYSMIEYFNILSNNPEILKQQQKEILEGKFELMDNNSAYEYLIFLLHYTGLINSIKTSDNLNENIQILPIFLHGQWQQEDDNYEQFYKMTWMPGAKEKDVNPNLHDYTINNMANNFDGYINLTLNIDTGEIDAGQDVAEDAILGAAESTVVTEDDGTAAAAEQQAAEVEELLKGGNVTEPVVQAETLDHAAEYGVGF